MREILKIIINQMEMDYILKIESGNMSEEDYEKYNELWWISEALSREDDDMLIQYVQNNEAVALILEEMLNWYSI